MCVCVCVRERELVCVCVSVYVCVCERERAREKLTNLQPYAEVCTCFVWMTFVLYYVSDAVPVQTLQWFLFSVVLLTSSSSVASPYKAVQ